MAHCHEMIVLDTCVIIWDALDASRLTPKSAHLTVSTDT